MSVEAVRSVRSDVPYRKMDTKGETKREHKQTQEVRRMIVSSSCYCVKVQMKGPGWQ